MPRKDERNSPEIRSHKKDIMVSRSAILYLSTHCLLVVIYSFGLMFSK